MQKFILFFLQQSRQRSGALIGLLLVLACIQGRAQSTQGAIVGSVKDASGAVVSGATVTLTKHDQEQRRR